MAEVKRKKQTFHKSTYFWRGPRPGAGQVLQAADAIVKRLTATIAELGLRRKHRRMAEVPAEGQNEAPPTEKPKVVDTPVGHDHPVQDGRQLQRQDVHRGGNQA